MPMYRQVAAYLEAKPAPPDGNRKRDDEAAGGDRRLLAVGLVFRPAHRSGTPAIAQH